MSNTRVYVWPKGETILENLANRHTRPYNEFRKLLTTILTNAGFSCLDAAGAHWSQKAGCACGCSPGFVLSKRLTTKEGRSVDIHADIVEAPKS